MHSVISYCLFWAISLLNILIGSHLNAACTLSDSMFDHFYWGFSLNKLFICFEIFPCFDIFFFHVKLLSRGAVQLALINVSASNELISICHTFSYPKELVYFNHFFSSELVIFIWWKTIIHNGGYFWADRIVIVRLNIQCLRSSKLSFVLQMILRSSHLLVE